jgi:hypothetical protein
MHALMKYLGHLVETQLFSICSPTQIAGEPRALFQGTQAKVSERAQQKEHEACSGGLSCSHSLMLALKIR